MKKVTQTVLIVLLILFISLALRLPYVGVPALNGDEGDNFDTVKLYLERGISPWERLVFIPPPYYWAVAVVAHFFGLNEITLRSVSVFFGSLTPILLFFFAKYIFQNQHKAFVTGLIAAVLPFFVLYSRDAHTEVMQVFFVVGTVWILEIFTRKKKNWNWWLLASIVATGLSVSIKYNAVVPLGIYWIFKLILSAKNQKLFKETLKFAFIINSFAFLLLILLTGFSPVRLAYFFYGILSWSINQSSDSNVPWYYYFSVLFDGLSPVFFILFIIAMCWWLYKLFFGRISEREKLVLFLCIFILFIIFIQGRKYPRHLMLTLPWAVLMMSDCIVVVSKCVRKYNKILPSLVLLIILVSTVWWDIGKILLYNQHTVWKDVGAYLFDTANKNSTVHVGGNDYWPLLIHSKYRQKISARLETNTLKNGDLVIVYGIDHNKSFIAGSPLQNDLWFHSPKYGTQYATNQTFYDYVQSKGDVLKEFKYDVVNRIKIIRISKLSPQQIQGNVTSQKRHDVVIQSICDLFWENQVIQVVLQRLSKRLYWEVEMKCSKGCVYTCDIF